MKIAGGKIEGKNKAAETPAIKPSTLRAGMKKQGIKAENGRTWLASTGRKKREEKSFVICFSSL